VRVESLLQKNTNQKWTVQYILSDTVPRRTPNKTLPEGAVAPEDAASVFNT
jgi:hypothetical protein